MPDEPDEDPSERSFHPADRARDKSDEFRMHAELAAVFEGTRKFDAQILPKLDAALAREIQRAMGKLDKSKTPDSPVLPEASTADAAALLGFPAARGLSTGDYHVHRRPGEVMIVRWLEGDQVATFYERIQAHFDAAMDGYREDEQQAHGWKQDPATIAYLGALEAIKLKMADKYLRDVIRQHHLFVLSTQTADEMNIAYLCDHVMGVPAVEVVGRASAPPDEPTDRDLAWFFKLFSLRGVIEGLERMCFFTYLQKADDSFDGD